MKATALIEKGKDGTFGIFTPDLKSTLIGEVNTMAEAKADFENSVKEVLLYYQETENQSSHKLQGLNLNTNRLLHPCLTIMILSM